MGEIFFPYCKNFFWLDDDIAYCPLLGQSASGLNFYDDSGRCPLAELKPFSPSFMPPLAD